MKHWLCKVRQLAKAESQRIMIARQGNIQGKKALAKNIAGIVS